MLRRFYLVLFLVGVALVSGLSTEFALYFRLLYVLGLTLVLSFVWSLASLQWLEVKADRRTRRVHVGDDVETEITVRNLGVLPKPVLEVADLTDLPGYANAMATSLRWRSSQSLRTAAPARQRGVYTVGPVMVSNIDVFGLFRREKQYGGEDSLIVLPRIFDAPELSMPATYLSGESSRRKRSHDLTPHAASVREYEFGDSASRVHWNSTARMDRLMSKEFDLGSARDVWLLVDLHRDVQAGELEESTDEYAASIAASLAKTYLEAQTPLGLVAYGDRRCFLPADTGAGQFERVVESLAMTKAEGTVPLEAALFREEALWGHQSSLVVITPSDRVEWVMAARDLVGRRIKMVVVLLAAESFGGPADTLDVVPELYAAGIPTYVMRNGDDMPLALSHTVTGSGLVASEQLEKLDNGSVTTGSEAVTSPNGEEGSAPSVGQRLWQWSTRLSPSQGWNTFVLLMATLVVIGESIIAADWVETPGLIAVLFYAAVTGLLLAKTKAPAFLLHPVGGVIGLVVVVWFASSLIPDQPLIEQVRELWSRLRQAYELASSDGFSTDMIPVTFALLAVAWVLGYAGSWYIFRRNNVWVAVMLAGIALISNFSFLPDPSTFRFFLFMFFAYLLIAQISTVQTHERWRKAKVELRSVSGWLTMRTALGLSAFVLLLAAFLPMKIVASYELAAVWGEARRPIANFEDGLARMFAGVPARKHDSGPLFGETLPLLGKVSLGGEVVFWANTNYPYYWISRTYSEYTSQGWKAGETASIEIGPDSRPSPPFDLLKRVPVEERVQLNVSTADFIARGGVEWISRDAVLESLTPKEFVIDIRDSSNDSVLPKDVRQLAEELRDYLTPPPEGILETSINRILPSDMVLKSVSRDAKAGARAAVEAVTLVRRSPSSPEIAAWSFTEGVHADDTYAVVSSISVATDDDLRAADADYEGFITDHYLQLPPALPQRIRDLAEEITEGAETPLDEALAVQSFLKGPEFKYSLDISAPPRGADGVDHFLFETRTGYSAYFASAMAVMLRAVGVPSRLAAGFDSGEESTEDGRRIVKDTDSHGWVQVYFPFYGWIDFEPTPTREVPDRRLLAGLSSGTGFGGIAGSVSAGGGSEDCDPLQAIDVELDCEGIPSGENPFESSASSGAAGSDGVTPSWVRVALVVGISVSAAFIAAAWLILRIPRIGGLSGSSPVEAAYTRMNRLGALAGLKRGVHQTPVEYAVDIGNSFRPSPATPSRLRGPSPVNAMAGVSPPTTSKSNCTKRGNALGVSSPWGL